MKHFAVIGFPIGHSLSPLMHNTAFQILGLDHRYESIEVSPEALKEQAGLFRRNDWGGFNVTAPHKEAIIPLIDDIDSEARAIGSVNTVVNSRGSLIGYNTDIIGIERSLRPYGASIDGNACLILGAGGAARSVAHVLTHNFKPHAITFWTLFPEQAHALVKSLKTNEVPFHVAEYSGEALEEALRLCTLVVNATTVGMYPKVLESPVRDQQLLTSHHIVFDLVYRPLRTRLLAQAEAAGATIIGGLTMFIHQGAAAFQLWLGREMPAERIRSVLEEKLNVEATA
jgi:shikimate dehydrogenase